MKAIPVVNLVFITSVHLLVAESLLFQMDYHLPEMLQSLQGMRTVHISLISQSNLKYPWSRFKELLDRWLALALKLRALSLQDACVEVVVEKRSSQEEDVWSSGEMEQWQSRTRSEVLNQVDLGPSPDDES